MNRLFLYIGIFIISFSGFSQVKSSWKEVVISQRLITEKGQNNAKRFYTLDITEFKKSLEILNSGASVSNKVLVAIPNSAGKMEEFSVVESSNFVPELQLEYPDIRSYSGTGITDSKASISFSISPKGIQTMILRSDSASEFIDPLRDNKDVYVVSTSKRRSKGSLPSNCKTIDVALNKELGYKAAQAKSSNSVFKTLRLALSCTGEYAEYFGGTTAYALAGMNATMTRVNGIFNRDLAIKLLLIANESSIIYTNATTDPYSDYTIDDPNDEVTDGSEGAWNLELQNTLTSKIGNANYDIGHLFSNSGEGGDAGCIGCVCVNPTASYPYGKGSAYTSPSDGVPEGDNFDIDFVAHEMGHQLGANHTFSHDVEGTGMSIEPGSGSTIMGYAGITDYNVQSTSDDYFAYGSIKQIQDNLANKTCPVSTAMTNQTPTVSAGGDYTIPKGTAFVLKGTASDPNGDVMTYCWEQNDSAIRAESEEKSIAYETKVYGPNFRSFLPSSVLYRYFPAIDRVLAGQLSSTWESVSTVARNMNFVFTARDNAVSGLAQTKSDAMVITVDATKGPFAITSQATSNTNWVLGSSQTITWGENGTNTLSGSAYVNIKLSTDGGVTFPTMLASNTLNDGSEVVTAPMTAAKNCRILIEPTGNVFYAVNKVSFPLGYSVSTACDTYTYDAPYSIPESATYAEKSIVVSTMDSEVTDVNFNVSFTHEYISDVQIELVSPKGTIVKLFDGSCGADSGKMDLSFDDLGGVLSCGVSTNQKVSPAESLSAFNGENPYGTWKLRFKDAWVEDTGTIDTASIQICSSSYTALGTSSFEINDFVLYPNPNKGNFTISFSSSNTSDIQVSVTDLSGRKVYNRKFGNTRDFNQNIQLKNVAAGTYIVTVEDGDRKGVSKIIVK